MVLFLSCVSTATLYPNLVRYLNAYQKRTGLLYMYICKLIELKSQQMLIQCTSNSLLIFNLLPNGLCSSCNVVDLSWGTRKYPLILVYWINFECCIWMMISSVAVLLQRKMDKLHHIKSFHVLPWNMVCCLWIIEPWPWFYHRSTFIPY